MFFIKVIFLVILVKIKTNTCWYDSNYVNLLILFNYVMLCVYGDDELADVFILRSENIK